MSTARDEAVTAAAAFGSRRVSGPPRADWNRHQPQSAADALSVLEEIARAASAEELPALIGQLERVKAVLFARLLAPTPQDRLLEAEEAAALLGVSTRTLYDRADEYDFTVRQSRRVKFSAIGIQRYLSRSRGDGGRLG